MCFYHGNAGNGCELSTHHGMIITSWTGESPSWARLNIWPLPLPGAGKPSTVRGEASHWVSTIHLGLNGHLPLFSPDFFLRQPRTVVSLNLAKPGFE